MATKKIMSLTAARKLISTLSRQLTLTQEALSRAEEQLDQYDDRPLRKETQS